MTSEKYKATKKWTSKKAVAESPVMAWQTSAPSVAPTPRRVAGKSQNIISKEITNAHSERSHPGISFLDLPGELRNQIYHDTLVFSSVTPIIPTGPRQGSIVFEIGSMKYRDEDWGNWYYEPTIYSGRTANPTLPNCKRAYNRKNTQDNPRIPAQELLGIISICRQIYNEARRLFWAENSFLFHDKCDQYRFVGGLDQGRRELINRLGLLLKVRTGFNYPWDDDHTTFCEREMYGPPALGFSGKPPMWGMLCLLSGISESHEPFAKDVDTSFRPWEKAAWEKAAKARQSWYEFGKQPFSGIERSLRLPLIGGPRPGGIWDRGPTGVLADYEAGRRTSLDVLGGAIRHCRLKGNLGWKLSIEHREWQDCDGVISFREEERPHVGCLLWMERPAILLKP